jgi:hypothetical protein
MGELKRDRQSARLISYQGIGGNHDTASISLGIAAICPCTIAACGLEPGAVYRPATFTDQRPSQVESPRVDYRRRRLRLRLGRAVERSVSGGWATSPAGKV